MTKNLLKYALAASALLVSIAHANNSTNNNASSTAASENSPAPDNNESTFGHLETLDRNIEATNKEIKSLQMANQLKTLKKQAQDMQTNFEVLRIYGIDNKLMASIQFENNTTVDVQTGDRIDDRYSVEKITNKQVILYDQKTKSTLNAPFSKS